MYFFKFNIGASELSRIEVEEEMKRGNSTESKSSDSNSSSSKGSRPKSSRYSKCDAAPIKLKQIQTNADGSLSLIQRGTPLKHEVNVDPELAEKEKFVPKQMAQRYGTKKTLETKPIEKEEEKEKDSGSAGSTELPTTKFVPKQMAQRYGTKKKV